MDENKLNKEIDNLREKIDIAKIDRISKVSKIISFTIIPIMFILFIYGSMKLTKLNDKISNTESQLKIAENKLHNYGILKDSLENQMNSILATSLNAFGWPIEEIKLDYQSSGKISEALNANNQIRKTVFESDFKILSKIIIQYYPKDKDKFKVVASLEEFGFEVYTKNSNPKLLNENTNTIWFGKSVPIEYVKIVAYTLIRAGTEIKFIRQVDNIQNNKIIIGTLYPHQSKSRILVSEIKNASEFKKCSTMKLCD